MEERLGQAPNIAAKEGWLVAKSNQALDGGEPCSHNLICACRIGNLGEIASAHHLNILDSQVEFSDSMELSSNRNPLFK